MDNNDANESYLIKYIYLRNVKKNNKMPNIQETSAENHLKPKMIELIDSIVDKLTVDRLSVELDIANDDQTRMFTSIIKRDEIGIGTEMNKMRKSIVAPQLLKNLFIQMKDMNLINSYITVESNKAYVWVVISDGDDRTEDALINLISTINSKYSTTGLSLDLTIFYESDNLLPPPAFYKVDL